MDIEDVRQNYNSVGVALIEMMYSGGYLSLGGTVSTDLLAVKAGIDKNSRVLDVGSGLGGPSLRLAKTFGCRVSGLDLMELNVEKANTLAVKNVLEHLLDFKVGDATDMPFEDGSFDVVIGQDAWCHVPDKNKLVAECGRVLRQGGRIAFTDWIKCRELTSAEEIELSKASASINLASMADYSGWISTHGLTITSEENISADFVATYRAIIRRVKAMEVAVTEKFNAKIFAILLEKNSEILHGFEDGKIGGCRLVAEKN